MNSCFYRIIPVTSLFVFCCLVGSGTLYAGGTQSAYFDYLSVAEYGKLLPIEPAGYFAIGRRYIHPPRVEWAPVTGAASYELILVKGDKVLGVTKAVASPRFIENGWDKAGPGRASIIIQAFDSKGDRIALSRMFPVYVAPDFDKSRSSKMKRPYKEAAIKAFNALYDFKLPASNPAPAQGPGSRILPILLTCAVEPESCVPYSFPNLHDWLHVEMLVALNRIADEPLKEKILKYARSVGEHLLMCRITDANYVYNGMIRGCADFNGGPAVGLWNADKQQKEKFKRLIEPAKCGYSGEALVKIYEMTGDARYLDAAVKLADSMVKTQLDDGSWHARVDGRTGEVLGAYSTSAISVASFLDRLNRHRPDSGRLTVRDRAVQWMLGNPVRTYAWVVNFDDVPTSAAQTNLYQNLSNWDLFAFVRYISTHPQIGDAAACIKEQFAWSDNHFVFYGSDPILPFEPFYPCCAEQGNPSISQEYCWWPMDFHTANWASALLAAYRFSGDKNYLDKAKTAANTLTQYQLDDGRTMTWMCDRQFGVSAAAAAIQSFWPGGWALSAAVWAELAAMQAE